MDVTAKVVLLTGALGGIGVELAKSLLEFQIKGIALLDADISKKDEILTQFNETFGEGKAIVIKADVTKNEDVKNAFDKTIDVFKQLDIVINGAGIMSEDWEKEIEVNYKGTFRVMDLALKNYLPKYKSGKEGIIVNIASIAGLDPFPINVNYGVTKCAIVHLTRSHSHTCFQEKYNVKLLAICPGITETPILCKIEKTEFAKSLVVDLATQTAEQLASHIVECIRDFKNGDVFVIEGNEKYNMKFFSRLESSK